MPLRGLLAVNGIGCIVPVYDSFPISDSDRTSGVGAVAQAGIHHAFQHILHHRIGTAGVEVVKVQPVWLPAVIILVDQFIVVDPHGGADGFQQLIYLLIGGIRRAAVGVLIVCKTADDDCAASLHIIPDKIYKFILENADLRFSGIIAGVFERGGNNKQGNIA